MDQPDKSRPIEGNAAEKPAGTSDLAVDEFFNQLQSDMRRPDLSQEAIASAFQAIQKLALETGSEEAGVTAAKGSAAGAVACTACHAPNPKNSRFCSACGVVLPRQVEPARAATDQGHAAPTQPGPHHYHHHYHHHYFAGAGESQPGSFADLRPPVNATVSRDVPKARVGPSSSGPSKAELAVRKMTQDWAQACNTKHLDDLVEFYASDALMLRPNLPPLRGTVAIREFFFTALDAGLGDAEFEPLRVEVFGDVAFEAGRFKVLVPIVVGKRREERGKYMILFTRQPTGEWKALADCWSSDLNLATGGDPGAPTANPSLLRPIRKI